MTGEIMEYGQSEDPTIRDYCEWQRSSWSMDEILALDETFSEEEVTLMGSFQPSNDFGQAQRQEHSSDKGLLEEALSSIGMRQLLPHISINHSSSIADELRQLHYPGMANSYNQSYFNSEASVFVPVSDTLPAKAQIKAEAPAKVMKCTEEEAALHPAYSMGSWNSSSEACVPDMSPRGPLGTPRSCARVPDCFHGNFHPESDSANGQIQAAYLCNTRQLRPRMSVKSEDDSLSSDEEKGTGGCYDPLDEMPRIVPDTASSLNRRECLQRYRDKKQRRHFTHKVRYTARKLNADRRPRIKGRFVKAADIAAAVGEV
ncbi:probable zinc finger protein CONSTANS-LIKE 6 at C-terminar half [Coccomyxa sp. Obi]|nr:probable zinc finger protein CONSTANS-LIKE 6 at C-terminar half [Coccomyxa sp. Obi]